MTCTYVQMQTNTHTQNKTGVHVGLQRRRRRWPRRGRGRAHARARHPVRKFMCVQCDVMTAAGAGSGCGPHNLDVTLTDRTQPERKTQARDGDRRGCGGLALAGVHPGGARVRVGVLQGPRGEDVLQRHVGARGPLNVGLVGWWGGGGGGWVGGSRGAATHTPSITDVNEAQRSPTTPSYHHTHFIDQAQAGPADAAAGARERAGDPLGRLGQPGAALRLHRRVVGHRWVRGVAGSVDRCSLLVMCPVDSTDRSNPTKSSPPSPVLPNLRRGERRAGAGHQSGPEGVGGGGRGGGQARV